MIKCESCCLPCSISFLFEPVVVCLFVGVHYIIKGAPKYYIIARLFRIGPAPFTAFFFHCNENNPPQSNARHCTPLYRASRPRNRSCTSAPSRSRGVQHEHDRLVCQRDPALQRRGTMGDAQFFRAGCCTSAARSAPAERLEDTFSC